ncbi:MAG: hypothetical protein H6679_05895 [Epsilonproteobacteria bacterium]|nr:hypothetical protein [Campylobacterota bacterium]
MKKLLTVLGIVSLGFAQHAAATIISVNAVELKIKVDDPEYYNIHSSLRKRAQNVSHDAQKEDETYQYSYATYEMGGGFTISTEDVDGDGALAGEYLQARYENNWEDGHTGLRGIYRQFAIFSEGPPQSISISFPLSTNQFHKLHDWIIKSKADHIREQSEGGISRNIYRWSNFDLIIDDAGYNQEFLEIRYFGNMQTAGIGMSILYRFVNELIGL